MRLLRSRRIIQSKRVSRESSKKNNGCPLPRAGMGLFVSNGKVGSKIGSRRIKIEPHNERSIHVIYFRLHHILPFHLIRLILSDRSDNSNYQNHPSSLSSHPSTMTFDKLKLFAKVLSFFIPYGLKLLFQRVAALHHKWTYKATSTAKNVVVLGGSFAGLELARRLSETLPTGHKVVLIEKNSHFNYSFNFPRFSVLTGYERMAFIPYRGIIERRAPDGIFLHVRDTAENITETQVLLASGETVDYEYLAVATGSSQPLPGKVSSTDRDEACSELRSVQEFIKAAKTIAVVGGGAVGIELASDIKDFYPDKDVTLIHSRGQLLNSFGKRLHDHVLPVLQGLKVRVLLNERPQVLGGVMGRENTLIFSDGKEETFDLVVSASKSLCFSSASASSYSLWNHRSPVQGNTPTPPS